MNEIKTIRGKLTISKPTGGPKGIRYDRVTIRVEDKNACGVIFDVDVSLHEFGLALFSAAYRPCKVSIRRQALKRLGKQLETNTIRLPIDGIALPSEETIAPYEVDGWRCDAADRPGGKFNHHQAKYAASGSSYQVTFRRWVKPARKSSKT